MTIESVAPARTGEEAAVRAVLNGIVDAWGRNDADAFAGYYVEDATVVLPGGVYHQSREEIRDYMAAGFAGPMKGSVSTDQQENVRLIGDGTAVVISLSGFRMPGEVRVAPERLRRATWVLSKRGGDWLVAAYHNCSTGAAG
jgi:uncharacterized protein (TIGR02246 family)